MAEHRVGVRQQASRRRPSDRPPGGPEAGARRLHPAVLPAGRAAHARSCSGRTSGCASGSVSSRTRTQAPVARSPATTAIRDLLRKIEELEQEKQRADHRRPRPTAATDEFASRYAEVENELANLANLYVATRPAAPGAQRARRPPRRAARPVPRRGGFARLLSDDATTDTALVADREDGIGVTRSVARVRARGRPRGAASRTSAARSRRRARDTSTGSQASIEPGRGDPARDRRPAPRRRSPSSNAAAEDGVRGRRSRAVQAPQRAGAPAIVHARLFTDAGRKVPGVQAFLDLED